MSKWGTVIGEENTIGSSQALDRWEGRAEWPLAIVAVIFLVGYSVQVLADPNVSVRVGLDWVLAIAWFVFVVDYVARLALAPDRGRWFVRHIFDLAIVVLPALRPLRLLRLLVVVSALQRAIGTAIRGRVAVYTVCSAILFLYAASLAIYETERDVPGASITSFGDALWWSVTTVTTVGYGDYSPVTASGRVIAACLMIGGISLIGVVTATIASWIVERVSEGDDANAAATRAQIENLRDEVQNLQALLAAAWEVTDPSAASDARPHRTRPASGAASIEETSG